MYVIQIQFENIFFKFNKYHSYLYAFIIKKKKTRNFKYFFSNSNVVKFSHFKFYEFNIKMIMFEKFNYRTRIYSKTL